MLMLVDGMNMAKASFHVAKDLRASTGLQTGTAYNFLGQLRKAIIRYKPTEVHVLWDSRPTWREQIYPEYKGNRDYTRKDLQPGDPDWYAQKELLLEILPKLPVFHTEGSLLEADDLAWLMQDSNQMNVLVSNDVDWLQLISPRCVVFQTLKKDDGEVNLKNFEERTGYKSTSEMIDCYSITGQSKDNIPGLDGVASKGAIQFVRGNMPPLSPKAVKIQSWINDKETGMVRTRLLFEIKNCPPSLREGIYSEKGVYDEVAFREACAHYEFRSTLNNYDSWIKPFLALQGETNAA